MQVQEDRTDRISITNGRGDQSVKNKVRNVRDREHYGEEGCDYSQDTIEGYVREREWDDFILRSCDRAS
jgi:hypothetical protein